ncbi:hypothetical protein LTR86_001710 [Recurvomyces mirabilis]|nr:hypothetical protein LTR86_001710 [Recurvomyces mirabilis]
MKSTSLLITAFGSLSAAYPSILQHLEANEKPKAGLQKRVAFDAAAQYISTTGDHAFVAPSATDQRGPCPGLNAMANHGYLPHNGIATIEQLITQVPYVFGMGVDLATVLAVYGAVIDGDLTSYSIGGPDSRVSLLGLGLLGEPQGLSGSHNKYEGDVSPIKGDLYQYGNDYLSQVSQFQALYDLGKGDDNYDLQLLTDYRATRFQESISQNPYFFNAPFSGVIAQPAAWAFIYRFMSNKSEEYPEGQLNGDLLKTFYAISGEDGAFTYTPGHERIPDNWYTRNQLDAYSIPYLTLDTLSMSLQHLEFLSIGGNTGTTNSFVGLDPEELTAGVFNAATLAEGNNALCYGLQLTVQELPDLLSGLFTDISAAQDKLGSVLTNATGSLGCPKLNSVNKDQFAQFPGYTKAYSGYDPPSSGLLGL